MPAERDALSASADGARPRVDVHGNLRDIKPMSTMRAGGVALLALIALLIAAPSHSREREIYPAPEQASADLAAALKAAAAENRRVILDFGGNWCPDCQALDIYFHDAANKPILEANYVLVHVNIGLVNQNFDIAARYGIPLNKGVPALAVLDAQGKLLYSQKAGEFAAMRHMESAALTQFLLRWKAA
jgi:thioredoxin 1